MKGRVFNSFQIVGSVSTWVQYAEHKFNILLGVWQEKLC